MSIGGRAQSTVRCQASTIFFYGTVGTRCWLELELQGKPSLLRHIPRAGRVMLTWRPPQSIRNICGGHKTCTSTTVIREECKKWLFPRGLGYETEDEPGCWAEVHTVMMKKVMKVQSTERPVRVWLVCEVIIQGQLHGRASRVVTWGWGGGALVWFSEAI